MSESIEKVLRQCIRTGIVTQSYPTKGTVRVKVGNIISGEIPVIVTPVTRI